MNKQFEAFARQAIESLDSGVDPDDIMKFMEAMWPGFNNKFAELIIRECAKIAKKEQAYNDGHGIHVNIDQCILIEFGL